MRKPREHQAKAIEAILSSREDGRIVIPTGGGKTMIEAHTLRDSINSTKGSKIYLVLAPRIQLANQLIREYRRDIGQSYIAVAFHSGRTEPDYDNMKWSEISTTDIDQIKEQHERAKRMGKHLVIFSTYHSSCKLDQLKFELVIADESQYCVSENFYNSVHALSSVRKLYFTATEKHTPTEDGRGLNNSKMFGDVIYQVAPKTLIRKNIIVAPRLHVMSASADKETTTVLDEIKHLAQHQMKLAARMPVTKVLFASNSTKDVKIVIENVKELKKEFPEYKIFTIVSNSKFGAMIDGVQMPRGDWMSELRATDHALIFHYDILSEGIDVDGITGVAIMRNMHHAKLLQTIGRAVRIYKANPELKKWAWVSVVLINGNDETADNLARTVRAIREGGYEVNTEEVEFTDDTPRGIADEDAGPENVIPLDRKAESKSILKKILHDVETEKDMERLANLSIEDQMKEVA
jgi:superfamily II DNA or RNA helicase